MSGSKIGPTIRPEMSRSMTEPSVSVSPISIFREGLPAEFLKVAWRLPIFVTYLIQEGFDRGAEFFVAIAGLAGRHHIASRAFPSPRQRHHMVHGQVFHSNVLVAEVTDSLLDLHLPPGRLS